MKNTVQFGQNLAKLPEILFAHSSRNRHFETELYRSLKHTYKITHNNTIKYTDIPVNVHFVTPGDRKIAF
jgi:hypothetical protein